MEPGPALCTLYVNIAMYHVNHFLLLIFLNFTSFQSILKLTWPRRATQHKIKHGRSGVRLSQLSSLKFKLTKRQSPRSSTARRKIKLTKI